MLNLVRKHRILLAINFSRSFAKGLRSEIGLKFVNKKGSFPLNNGMTLAHLSLVGKMPCENDKLNICSRGSINSYLQCFNRKLEILSIEEHLELFRS